MILFYFALLLLALDIVYILSKCVEPDKEGTISEKITEAAIFFAPLFGLFTIISGIAILFCAL